MARSYAYVRAGIVCRNMVYLTCWKGAAVGVIDAIADGCFAVARRPWVLLPLVLLDLLYWLGARLSVAPLLDGPIALLEWAARQAAAAPDAGAQSAQAATDLAAQIAELRAAGGQGNLLELLAIGQSPLLPKLAGEEVGRPWGGGVLDLGSGWLTALAGLGLIVAGLLWFAVALAIVGALVRDEALRPGALARRAWRIWGHLIALAGLLVGATVFLAVPLAILAALLQLLGLSPGVPVLLAIVPVLLAWLFLSRTTDAMAVSDAGPLRAIKLSVMVVRRNFWPMLRLFAAGWLISVGFPIAWAFLARQAAGVPLAIIGNAYLNTGLLAAAMILYRECAAALDRPAAPAGPPRQGPPTAGRD